MIAFKNKLAINTENKIGSSNFINIYSLFMKYPLNNKTVFYKIEKEMFNIARRN
jgi:hypothetical protein